MDKNFVSIPTLSTKEMSIWDLKVSEARPDQLGQVVEWSST